MPADAPDDDREKPASAPRNEDVGATPPAKPKRKRAPRPTFEDGSLTRVFKFPCRKYPRSSYYVTGDEIIIRIKKGKKRWKLVVSKKRLVTYRTTPWFTKPRWVEIELTYTQAVRHGLVEPAAKPAPVEAADPVASEPAAETAHHELDEAITSQDELPEDTEAGAEEVTGWVADDDATGPGSDDAAFDTFDDAGDEAAEADSPHAARLEKDTDAAHLTGVAAMVPDPTSTPCADVRVELAEPPLEAVAPANALQEEAGSGPAVVSQPETEVDAAAPVSEPAAAGTQPATPPAIDATVPLVVIAPVVAMPAPQKRSAMIPSSAPMPPPPPKRRLLDVRLLPASLAVVAIGIGAWWQQSPEQIADAPACAQAQCADREIVTGSIETSGAPRAAIEDAPVSAAPVVEVAAPPAAPAVAVTPPAAVVAMVDEARPKVEEARVVPPPAAAPSHVIEPATTSVAAPGVREPEATAAAPVEIRPEPSAPRAAAPAVAMATEAAPVTPQRAPDLSPEMSACRANVSTLARDTSVTFGFASATLTPASVVALGHLSAALKPCRGVKVTIQGHTDSDGDNHRNQVLSLRRAMAVWQRLFEAGAGENQLVVIGYGQERPLVSNDTPANKSRNRRIELVVE